MGGCSLGCMRCRRRRHARTGAASKALLAPRFKLVCELAVSLLPPQGVLLVELAHLLGAPLVIVGVKAVAGVRALRGGFMGSPLITWAIWGTGGTWAPQGIGVSMRWRWSDARMACILLVKRLMGVAVALAAARVIKIRSHVAVPYVPVRALPLSALTPP